jgi:alpha-galactosidase
VGPNYGPLAWWEDGVTASGAVLTAHGVQLPAQHPEQLVLLEVTRRGA